MQGDALRTSHKRVVGGQVINNGFLAQKRYLSLPANRAKLVSFVVFQVSVSVSVAVGLDSSSRCHKARWASTSN